MSKFDQWIYSSFSVSPEGLAVYRMLTALMILFFLSPDAIYYSTLSSLPNDFFAPPPGPLLMFGGFPPEIFFSVLHSALVVSLLGMLFGYKTKISSILSGVFMLVILGFTFSIGKTNHIHTGVVLIPIVMAFSNWGAAYSIDEWLAGKRELVQSWPLSLMALFIGFMMFTAGFPKILGGWLSPETQAVQGHILNQIVSKERTALLSESILQIESVIFWETIDWATIIFEIGFFASILKPAWFKRFLGLAVVFHFSTMSLMNISFLSNVVAYCAFINWTKIDRHVKEVINVRGFSTVNKIVPLVLLITSTVFFVLLKIVDDFSSDLVGPELSFHEIFFLGMGFVLVSIYGIKEIWKQIKPLNRAPKNYTKGDQFLS